MNTLFRPFIRTHAFRNTPLAFRRPLTRPALLNSTLLHARTVASSVTNRPGSQTLEHAAQNIKEEIGNSTTDLAKVIAGANMTTDQVAEAGKGSFLGITSLIASEVPKPVMVFGLLGGLPYLGASATTVYLAHSAGQAASGVATNIDPGVALTILDQALNIQVTYGAVMLSFLGALHWGMEFAGYGGHKGYARLALGAAPVLFAWPTLALQPMTALILQWAGFTGLWWADAKPPLTDGRQNGTLSIGSTYPSSLVLVLLDHSRVHPTNGPVAGHGLVSHDLDMIREERKKLLPQRSGVIPGDLEAAPAGEDAANFVRIHRREHKKEGEDKKEQGSSAESS